MAIDAKVISVQWLHLSYIALASHHDPDLKKLMWIKKASGHYLLILMHIFQRAML